MADTYFKRASHNVKLVDLGGDRYSQSVTLDGTNSLNISNAITAMAHTTVAVATASVVALTTNTSRKYALIVNPSDTDLFISFTALSKTDSGIFVSAEGGNYEMSSNAGNLYTGAITAIHDGTAIKTVLVTEGT